jgi:hypothetical protein
MSFELATPFWDVTSMDCGGELVDDECNGKEVDVVKVLLVLVAGFSVLFWCL